MTKFITHVAFYCQDLGKTVSWYQDVLEMNIVAEAPGRFAALSFGDKHHDLALVQAPEGFGKPEVQKAGLYHYAIDTGSFDASMKIYERAKELGVVVEKAMDHRLGRGIYIRDPDLNLVELWSESYPSYVEAIASLTDMDPPFSENPVGWPIDDIYAEWKKLQGEP